VKVPDVVGLTIEDAQAALSAVGLQTEPINYHAHGFVIDQNPNAGDKALQGSIVRVRLL
jgi:beta-lactam-binding protein with PASTA domain